MSSQLRAPTASRNAAVIQTRQYRSLSSLSPFAALFSLNRHPETQTALAFSREFDHDVRPELVEWLIHQ